MAISADLANLLDKDYENLSLEEVLDAPVSALSGVSEGDAEKLEDAFNVRTVRDLGRNKFFRAAASLVDLENSAS